MNAQEIRSVVLEALTDVAPEVDPASVKGDVDLREQFDIDSMDFLNFLIGLSKRFQVDVPEADYGKLATLDACVTYIVERANK